MLQRKYPGLVSKLVLIDVNVDDFLFIGNEDVNDEAGKNGSNKTSVPWSRSPYYVLFMQLMIGFAYQYVLMFLWMIDLVGGDFGRTFANV